MQYKKNFLTQVIVRADFPSILLLKEKEPGKFQDLIRNEFPKFSSSVNEVVEGTRTKTNIIDKFSTWVFKSKDENCEITLTHNFIAFTSRHHRNFEESIKIIWDKIWGHFYNTYKTPFCSRLGLRYINEIELRKGSPIDWSGYINEHLISNLNFLKDKGDILRSMQQAVIGKDDFKITLTHGIFNSDYPNIATQRKYILDIDSFCDLEIDQSEISSKLVAFHDKIKDIFEASIGIDLRREMGFEDE